jgi:hypothetical protein
VRQSDPVGRVVDHEAIPQAVVTNQTELVEIGS